MGRLPTKTSKTYSTPRRPFEKERLDQELKLIGEFGLRNKREVWRVKLALAKIRKSARVLLTLEEKHPRRLFEGMGYSYSGARIFLASLHLPFCLFCYLAVPSSQSNICLTIIATTAASLQLKCFFSKNMHITSKNDYACI